MAKKPEIEIKNVILPTEEPKSKGPSNLTPPEKRFIEENWTKPGWTDATIAKHLNRNPMTIARYRKKKGYVKGNSGNIIKLPPNNKEMTAKKLSPDLKLEKWRHAFIVSNRFQSLKDKLTAEEKDYFTDLWAEYHMQFEDMLPSEEDTLEVFIRLKLRLNSNQKSLKDCKDYQQTLEDQIAKLGNSEIDVEIEQQRQLREMILQINKNELELNKEFRELVDKYEKILRAMNATREQREERQNVGGDTFTSLVKQFNDRDKRREIGKYNELMKIAAAKKMKEFKQPHEFADKNLEPIIMDGRDYMNQEIAPESDRKPGELP